MIKSHPEIEKENEGIEDVILREYIYVQLDVIATARRSLVDEVRWDVESNTNKSRKIMNEGDVFIRKAGNYRIWVDEAGVGRIRILKRINFTVLVAIFEELHSEIKKRLSGNAGKIHIVFYISKSLYNEMSVNAKEFLGFCQSCMGITFELVLIEL